MTNTSSAAKQARASLRSRLRNQKTISQCKTLEKKIRALAAKGSKDEAKKMYGEFQCSIDLAYKRNVIHRNKAARAKSRVARFLAKA